MTTTSPLRARRVLAGCDESGASCVVSEMDGPETVLPNGIILQEVWQQRRFPAGVSDEPSPDWTLGPAAPVEGVVVRILTVPPPTGGDFAPVEFHTDASLHVITMLDGELDFVLESGRITLLRGESIVLRDSMHDLSNTTSAPARFVYTSIPLSGGRSGP